MSEERARERIQKTRAEYEDALEAHRVVFQRALPLFDAVDDAYDIEPLIEARDRANAKRNAAKKKYMKLKDEANKAEKLCVDMRRARAQSPEWDAAKPYFLECRNRLREIRRTRGILRAAITNARKWGLEIDDV
jgi:hypothetical protein